jgi:phytoene dehydrogenase-like protein
MQQSRDWLLNFTYVDESSTGNVLQLPTNYFLCVRKYALFFVRKYSLFFVVQQTAKTDQRVMSITARYFNPNKKKNSSVIQTFSTETFLIAKSMSRGHVYHPSPSLPQTMLSNGFKVKE